MEYGVFGGIIGYVAPFNNATHENYLYYCYNKGNITGSDNVGSVVGYYSYIDADYIYGLEKETENKPILGNGDNLKNATKKGLFNKSTLTSTVLANFGNNFKADYEENINDGFPILDWQPQESVGPNV